MKKIYSFSIFLSFIISSFAQVPAFRWAQQVGGKDDDNSTGLSIDRTGNAIQLGTFQGAINIVNGNNNINLISHGGADIFIKKTDRMGNLLWMKQIGNTQNDFAKDVISDDLGNCYITGAFTGTIDFDPGNDINNLTASGVNDAFLLKLDNNGNFLWVKQFSGTQNSIGNALTLDSIQNIYVIGSFSGNVDFNPDTSTFKIVSKGDYDAFVCKIASDGNFVWAKNFGGAGTDEGYAISPIQKGSLFVTGYFSENADFDPDTAVFNLQSHGEKDVFIAKLNTDAAFVLAKCLGGNATDIPDDITLDKSGNIIISGTFDDMVDLNPGNGVLNFTSKGGGADIFMVKLDEFGNFIWARTMGSIFYDYGSTLSTDKDENIFIAGNYEGTLYYNTGSSPKTMKSNGNYDIFCFKLDKNGFSLWATTIGDLSNDIVIDNEIDNFGNNYLVGNFSGQWTIQPSDSIMLKSRGLTDALLLKQAIGCEVYSFLDIIPCNKLKINGQSIYIPGLYIYGKFITANDCDSMVVANVRSFYYINTTIIKTDSSLISNYEGPNYQWVSCPSYTIIPGETNRIFNSPKPGSYAVIVINGICTDTSICMPVYPVGIRTNEIANKINVFPNPTSGVLNVEIPLGLHFSSWSIYNTYGALINTMFADSSEFTIDISNEPNGVYFIQLNGDIPTFIKIIKN